MDRAPHLIRRWFDIDPYLARYREQITERFVRFNYFRRKLCPDNDLTYATKAYEYFGIHVDRSTGVVTIREWAPGAKAVYFAGDFNYWNRSSHPFTKLDNSVWELILQPDSEGGCLLRHLSEVKIIIENAEGVKFDRLSPWATYVEAPLLPTDTQYRQKIWLPTKDKLYQFYFPKPKRPRSLKIYEAHVGIATGCIDVGIEMGTYKKFAREILPRIKANGYNALQLMAIMEHAYYASFGYQVTSFFAVSSRYGTPEDLKALIDRAHSLGIFVILDIIHSHASSNVDDGLNEFDGTKGCFFYDDSRGYHSLWGSRMFNTNNVAVLRFLISNACWYVDEYNFDGFRFDGITAMMYKSRGIDQSFSGNYDEYFGDLVDPNGPLYCQLMNYFLHRTYRNMLTIAEEVSGMPGICRPTCEGGLGFDYRLAMAIPDKWIKLLKTKRDETWDMADLVWTHSNRRHKEPHVAYCESHDQALVGDKTISFWLMDALMYHKMVRRVVLSVGIDRGIALHKVIRLFTHTLGGEAYLNFIGNEFGHPEWLDFPRAGNAWSYHYCRRQWKLVDNKDLLYYNLNEFDKAMNLAEEKYGWLSSREAYVSLKHEDDKIVVFERANLVFAFNFHVTKSFSDYMIGVDMPGEYECILSTDEDAFAGYNRVDRSIHYITSPIPYCNRRHSMRIYIPNRAAIVLARSFEVLEREIEYEQSVYKTVAEISTYAYARRKEIRELEEQAKSVELVEKLGKTSISDSPRTGDADASQDASAGGANVSRTYESDTTIVGTAIVPTITGRTSAESLASAESLLEITRPRRYVERPPLGERVGGGETPPADFANILFDAAINMQEDSGSSGETSGEDLLIITEETVQVNIVRESGEYIEEGQCFETHMASGSASTIGAGSQSGQRVVNILDYKSSASTNYLSPSSSRYDASSSIFIDAKQSTSTNYVTPSSSRYNTAQSVSDFVPDLSLWSVSSTSIFSSENFESVLERVQALSIEDTDSERFENAFEDLPEDNDNVE